MHPATADDIRIETLRPGELGEEDRAAWRSFRAARPELASPYFDLRFVLAAGEIAPHAAVAVVRRGGRAEAFLPFQRRAGLIQPLGAPLNDYHGPIAAPGVTVDIPRVLKALGAHSLRFSGLTGDAPARRVLGRAAMAADLSGGFEAYLSRRQAAGQGAALKDKRRRARALARDHGEPEFTFGRDPGGLLELIVARKREQMRRTGQHDVLGNPWTRALLERLSAVGDADFGLRFAALRVGGRVIAAEAGLLSGGAYHLWFPIYDPAFARYSPGALMTLESLRALARLAVSSVDFGPGDEDYKRMFAEPGASVWEGQVHADGVAALCWQVGERVVGLAPFLNGAWRAGVRRVDRIAASEPTLNGQVGAAARSVAVLGRRHRRKALWLGLAATGGLVLAAME